MSGEIKVKASSPSGSEKLDDKTMLGYFRESAVPGLFGRALAISVLNAVIDRGENFEDVCEKTLEDYDLSGKDYRFIRLIVLTTLRNYGVIQDITGRLLSYKPKHQYASFVMRVIEIGINQLLFLDTKPYAAVSTSVALTDALNASKISGFVNAVLRNLIRNREDFQYNVEKKARLNTPDWLWDVWSEAYGAERAIRIALMNSKRPVLSLTVPEDSELWAEKLAATPVFPHSLARPSTSFVKDLPGYDEGAWWVQDSAASLPVYLFNDLATNKSPIVDLCACPGGKTLQLAKMGIPVMAVDYSTARIKRLEENIARTGLGDLVTVIEANALSYKPETAPGRILLDAPCSTTGVIRRHPDIIFARKASEMKQFVALQTALLDSGWDMLAPGGSLVYSVCSLDPEEGEEQVRRFLEKYPDASVLGAEKGKWLGGDETITREGFIRTLPFFREEEGGMDGFFACAFKKKG